jgi:hypothetical protein
MKRPSVASICLTMAVIAGAFGFFFVWLADHKRTTERIEWRWNTTQVQTRSPRGRIFILTVGEEIIMSAGMLTSLRIALREAHTQSGELQKVRRVLTRDIRGSEIAFCSKPVVTRHTKKEAKNF